jgi:hypothetical protein
MKRCAAVFGGTGLLTGVTGELQFGSVDEVDGAIVDGTVEIIDPDT